MVFLLLIKLRLRRAVEVVEKFYLFATLVDESSA
jgi:hypothetical protein